jgi:DNA-binding beta-propeller fold protein YncE
MRLAQLERTMKERFSLTMRGNGDRMHGGVHKLQRRGGRDLRVPLLGVVLAVLLLAGCATVKKPEYTELLWPSPPLTSRIKFVGLLHNQEDLGRSAGNPFVDTLLGSKERPDSLEQPMGLATSQDGKRLYVTDYAKPAVFVFDFEARLMLPFGKMEADEFKNPLGIAVDDKDNVYVVDSLPKLIRVFDPSGKFLRNIAHDSLERPTGIAIDPERRRLYVADSSRKASENHVVHVFDLDGTYIKAFGGKGGEDGKFLFPTYLALDGEGNVYVTDTLNGRVQAFDLEGHYLRTFGRMGDSFGEFNKPKGVALDSFGNVYVVDSAWSNVQIFNQRQEVLLFFGGRGRYPGLLFNPTGIFIDKNNRIYVADAFNARIGIYQLINTTSEDSFMTLPPRSEKGGDPAARQAGRPSGQGIK